MNKMFGKRIFCITMVIVLLLGGFIFFSFGAGNKDLGNIKTAKFTGPKTRAGDYVSINDNVLGTYYPGDKDNTFAIRVDNDYNGEEWNDIDAGDMSDDWHWPLGTGEDLAYVKVSIEGVRDENQNPVSNNPTENFNQNVYNADGGIGYNISASGSYWFYNNQDGDDFSFDIKADVKPGNYFLEIKVTYYVRIDWDQTNGKFNITTSKYTETEFMDFSIVSGVEPFPFDGKIDADAYDDTGSMMNGGMLYAGSTFQEIRIPVTAKGFDMDNVQATMTPSKISLSNSDAAKIVSFGSGSNSYFAFRIEVPADLDPQVLTGCTLTVTYERTDQGETQSITESGIEVVLIIDYTPMFSPPAHEDFTSTATDIDQGDGSHDFDSFSFTNTGNVPLQDIDVNLDITGARYFSNGMFYYDEGAYGQKKPLKDITVNLPGPVSKGASEQVNFDPALLDKYLPPGYYKIPVTYDAWYYDTGELAGSTSWKKTDEQEYKTIFGAVTGSQETPFVFIEVTDSGGFSAEANCNQKFDVGDQGVNLVVTVNNFEYYQLTDVTFTLEGNLTGITAVDTEQKANFLFAAVQGVGPGTSVQTFTVNVDPEAIPGIYEGSITITGYDLKNELQTVTVTFSYEIVPIPPALIVVGVDTLKSVKPGKEFALDVTVMNTGGSEASDISVLLATNSALLTVTDTSPEKTIDSLPAGETETVTFNVKAHKDIDYATEYGGTVMFKFTDEQGNQLQYNQNAVGTANIRVVEEPDDTFFTLASSVFWAGLFMFIALIIVGVLIMMGIKSLAPKPAPVVEEKKTSKPETPPPPPPAEPVEDEKEDDSSHDTEKEPDLEPPEDLQEF